jgi:hypothetical protein
MAYIKFSPDLLLGVSELQRWKEFTDDAGFRKNILDNSTSFGLIKNNFLDPTFNNGKVERDLDTFVGQKTIKVRKLTGIDNNGNFLYSKEVNGIPVPFNDNWYWVKAKYAISNAEKGKFTISENGDLIDISGEAELLKMFRVKPHFPTRIKFINSTFNTLEYDVLDVIDNQRAILSHPATNAAGQAQFQAEANLQIAIVGTFTKNKTIEAINKQIFNYDYASIELVQETITNTKPAYTPNQEFYLARVKATGSTVIIQDKRNEYWQTNSEEKQVILPNPSPCIGIESIQFNNYYSAQDRNIVKIAWGMRSNNWSIDSSNNILTINSGVGGKFKTVNDFTNGDFDGWVVYTATAKKRKVLSSVKQGSAINLTLDVLDVDDFSADGGATFYLSYITIVPDCEEVEIIFIPNPADNNNAFTDRFVFPANIQPARCDVLVYADPAVDYLVEYRYKSGENYSNWYLLPSDAVGYYTETSFDTNGNFKQVLADRVKFPYVQNLNSGYIRMFLSPDCLRRFRTNVDKGDLIGVEEITTFDSNAVIDLIVGTAKNYQYIHGDIVINNDIFFALDSSKAVEGNEFRIHLDCTSLNLNGTNIYIVENYGLDNQKILKKIEQGDVYEMLNQEGGLVFTLKYKGVNDLDWIISQNYDLGKPFETTMFEGNVNQFFDTDGNGMVRGYYGWQLHTILNQGRTPVGFGTRTETYANGNIAIKNFNIGDTGGEMNHQLTVPELAKHKHVIQGIEGGDKTIIIMIHVLQVVIKIQMKHHSSLIIPMLVN